MPGRKQSSKKSPKTFQKPAADPLDDLEAGVLFDKDLIDTADDLDDLADDLLSDPSIQAALDDPTQDETW